MGDRRLLLPALVPSLQLVGPIQRMRPLKWNWGCVCHKLAPMYVHCAHELFNLLVTACTYTHARNARLYMTDPRRCRGALAWPQIVLELPR